MCLDVNYGFLFSCIIQLSVEQVVIQFSFSKISSFTQLSIACDKGEYVPKMTAPFLAKSRVHVCIHQVVWDEDEILGRVE